MSVLDDVNFIQKYDRSDALGLAAQNFKQLTYTFNVPQLTDLNIKNVVLTGMGGSALGPKLLASWLELDFPFEVVSDYSLPAYVGENTLVIASSFSGSTEETLACFEEAKSKGCKIVAIANGGELEQKAHAAGLTFVRLPDCPQPRFAAFYSFRATASVLVSAGLLPETVLEEISSVADFLKHETTQFVPETSTQDNPAKQLALELIGKSIVVYGSKLTSAVAYKWKISFNENAKSVAWWGVYPEFNHNEFIGWSSHPIDKPYAIIDIRSSFDHPQIKKRFEISDRLLSGKRPKATVVEPKGDSLLKQLVWATTYGDFVTLYVALLNELDPSPVDLIQKMKKEL